MKLLKFCILAVAIAMLFAQCHSIKWNDLNTTNTQEPAPKEVTAIFNNYPDGIMVLDAQNPGYSYKYDIGEKDSLYGKDSSSLRFEKVELQLHDKMPAGKVIVDFAFIDGNNNKVHIEAVDLMRLTPKIDAAADMIYPELLLEEFNRFGVTFREEHDEFEVVLTDNTTSDIKSIQERAYRASITNNCLAPSKWEFAIVSEDYSDFRKRSKSDININQNKILTHSWFYVDKSLYQALVNLKNPGKEINLDFNYDSLSNISEQVVVDFDLLRPPLKHKIDSEVLEIGHKSKRKLEPLDIEEYYKNQFGLVLEGKTETYSSILDTVVKTTQFRDEGYYKTATPKAFDLGWMRYMDDVQMDVIDVSGTEAYVQFTLGGEWSPYKVTIGNVDLALLSEQKLYGILFGINTYPKSRRYNPVQSTIAYDAELLPANQRQYVLLTDSKTGKWVNNQYKGIEKIYLTYESLERDVINIYVLSYERITPVWMARVKLPRNLREKVRIRKQLYNY
jgi:hypothetical protein